MCMRETGTEAPGSPPLSCSGQGQALPFLAVPSPVGPVASGRAQQYVLDGRTRPASHLHDPGQHPASRAQTHYAQRALRGSCRTRQGCLRRDTLAGSSRLPKGSNRPFPQRPGSLCPGRAPHLTAVPTAGSRRQHHPLHPPSPREGASAPAGSAGAADTHPHCQQRPWRAGFPQLPFTEPGQALGFLKHHTGQALPSFCHGEDMEARGNRQPALQTQKQGESSRSENRVRACHRTGSCEARVSSCVPKCAGLQLSLGEF